MDEQGLRHIGEQLKASINLSEVEKQSSDLSVTEVMRRRAERYNASVGKLNADGYNCSKCLNRGYTAQIVEKNGMPYEIYQECECMKVRRSIARIKTSGLENSIKNCKLSAYKATEPWQKSILDKANEYLTSGVNDGKWWYIGGQSGAGKTHICTGIARELLYSGHEVKYVIWEQASKALKAVMNEPEYEEGLAKLENAEILYIDDLFKPIADRPPTDADLRLAFELLNYRYANRKITLISSERFLGEIFELDEATGGRIYERSKGYMISVERDKERNYRRNEMREGG